MPYGVGSNQKRERHGNATFLSWVDEFKALSPRHVMDLGSGVIMALLLGDRHQPGQGHHHPINGLFLSASISPTC